MEKDILYIRELLDKVLGIKECKSFSRLGGLTNHTYKVVLSNNEKYVCRIPGEGTEEIIVRSDEKVSTTLACELMIDAELIYFGEKGEKISRYIPNAVTMTAEALREDEHIIQIADVLRKIHNCGKDTNISFDVFDMAKGYEKIILEKSIALFENYNFIKSEVMKIKEEMDRLVRVQRVPCHNDPLCENWIKGNGKLYLIDWEYAGMNDGMWDLADVSIEAEYTEEHEEKLLSAYLKMQPSEIDKKLFLANKIYVDYLWALWAKARIPYEGKSMEEWALERYERLKNSINKYNGLK